MQLKSLGNLSIATDVILKNASNFNLVSDAVKNLGTEYAATALLSSTLTDAEKVQILVNKGLSLEQANTALSTAALSTSQKGATASTLGLSAAFKGLGASIKSFVVNNPALTFAALAVAAATAGVAIYANLHPSLEAASKDLKDKKEEFDSITEEVSDLSTELEESKKRMAELQSLGSLSMVESDELGKLKETTAELETQLAIKKEEQRMRAKETATTANKAFHGTFRSKYDENGNLITGDASRGNTSTGHGLIEELKNSIKAYYKLQEQYNSAKLNADFFAKETEKNGGRYSLTGKVDWAEYEKFAKQMDSLQKQMDSASVQANKMYEAINAQKEAYEGLYNAGYDLNQEQTKEYETIRLNVDAYNDFCADINDTTKAFSELSTEQKRSKLETQFILSGKSTKDAKEIVNSLNDDDLDVVAKIRFDSSATKESVKKVLDEAKDSELEIKANITFSDSLASLPIDKVEEFVSLFKSGAIDENTISSYDELNAIMKETGLSAEEAVKSLKEFSNDYTLSSQLISDMESTTTLIAKLKDEIKQTGTLGTDSLAALAKQFPELEYAVSQFNQGLISTNDLIVLLQSAYESDADAFRTAMSSKLSGNETFFNTIKENNKGLFENLAEAYNLDVNNWKTLAQAKAAIDQQLIQNLSSAWSKYYGTIVDSATGMTKLTGPAPRHGSSQGVAFSDPEQGKAYATALDAVSKANALKNKLDEAAKIEIDVPDFGGIEPSGYKRAGSKDKKEKEPKSKDFDWIKRRQELLQKLHDQEEQNADDETKSYQTRIALINSLITKDNERLEFNKKAAESYTEVWEQAKDKIMSDAAKQGKDGDGIIANIMNGNTANQTFEGDLADSIQAGVDAYDDYTSGLENSEQIEQEINEHLKKQLELKVAITQAQTDILKSEMDSLDAEIKLMEATGQVVDEAQLKKQISLSEEIADSYGEQIDALRDQLDDVDEGSAEYYSIRSQIKQCESAIADCAVQQAEWNDQIKRLPIEKISHTLEMLGFIKEDLQNFIDQQNALGKATSLPEFQEMANISLKQIEELMKQQKLLSELLDDYEFGSTKYQDTVSDLQDIDNQISELIKDQYEWNKAILQLPIDQLSKTGDMLKSVVSALDEIMTGYDTAINAVTGLLDKQIETINDLKDATSKKFESKIKPLQDELDVLQKQNEARKIQLDLEKAQYDLDRANEQKTNKVIRDGEITYEADQDAIRSAENAKNDADYNKIVHDLETQISNLEEERDKLLEGYDLQIEKLDEIKDRWSSITEEIKLAADFLKANDILGSDWQGKILSGNDADMLNSIKDLYTTISNQKNQYEEQIASNERITDMMNKFMESWQNGSITYDQAMAGIKDLAAQMKDGYSSLEHLDAIMGLNGATDLGTLLSQMQNTANASVNQFEDYMKIVKENVDALDKYNSSWEEMQQNIRDQIEALEKLAEEAEKIANTVNKHSSGGGGGSSSKGPNINDKSYVSDGPGYTDEGYNNAVANGQKIRKYHKGGIVGNKAPKNEFQQLVAKYNLDTDEILAKIKEGEVVLTEEQQKRVMESYRQIVASYIMPSEYITNRAQAYDNRQARTPNVQITMGDINLPNVKDPDGFVKFLGSNFDSAINQQYSVVFNR